MTIGHQRGPLPPANAVDQRFTGAPAPDSGDPLPQWERIVLGKLLLMPDAAEHLLKLTVDDFADAAHQHIYASIIAHVEQGVDNTRVLADVIGVRAVMVHGDPMSYLSRLRAEGVDAVGDFTFHAARVREAADLRRLRKAFEIAQRAAESGSRDLALKALEGAARALQQDTSGSEMARRVDLTSYLNGTHTTQDPDVGGLHDSHGSALLYSGRWHTCIALTTAGKSWFALWHCVQEIRAGRKVVYAHFEETDPAGTIERLRSIAPELTAEQITELFVWLDCTRPWTAAEWNRAVPDGASLVVLDGINAACGQHGWSPDKPEAVGAYRALFVTPCTGRGMAALSLGHPVKNRDRQGERHGFGATGWLDEVDGVSFRMEASAKNPIRLGHKGYSTLFVVKDRYSKVQQIGEIDDRREAGWFRIGLFKIDSRPERRNTMVWLDAPQRPEDVGEGRAPELEMPTLLMLQISRALQMQEAPLSQNGVEALVAGRGTAKRAALEFLVNGGYVAKEKVGQAYRYSHLKAFVVGEGVAGD